jgi:uncharacterized membrane protein
MLEEQRTQPGAEPVLSQTEAPAATPEPVVPESETLAPHSRSPYADPVTWAIAFTVFGAYAALSLFRLLQLNPTSWDLGIYTEYVHQVAHLQAPVADIRGAGFNLLGDHFQPIVALLGPFFRIFPSAAALLVAQALLAALSVLAVSQAAREKLGTGPGRAVAIAYGFCWGLQQLAEFDFHEIAFAVPLLAFSLSALVRGRIKAAAWWALPLVFVKEDQGFTVAAIGLYLIVAGLRARSPEPAFAGTEHSGWRDESGELDPDQSGRHRIRTGQFLLIWGFAWSFLAIGVIIPHFNPAHQYDYWSEGGVLAPGAHLSVTGLVAQLFHAWPDKLQTVVMLLLPTAFIALRSPVTLIAVPSLLLRLESTDSSYWGTFWHYNATVMPVIFIAAVDALVRIHGSADGRPGMRRALWAGAQRYGPAMMLAIAVPLAFQFPLSNLWHAQTYRISGHVASAEAAMAKVPDGATVETTLNLLAALGARTDTFWIGNSTNPGTQYVVFDGKDSNYSPDITDVPAFIAQLYPHHLYTQIFESGDVYVFRRAK